MWYRCMEKVLRAPVNTHDLTAVWPLAAVFSLCPPAGEEQEVIAARKLKFPWGQWLKGGSADEGGSSEASAQTEACKAGCSHGAKGRASSPLSDDLDADADKDQVRAQAMLAHAHCACSSAGSETTMCSAARLVAGGVLNTTCKLLLWHVAGAVSCGRCIVG